ncbi:MAG: type II toxin-antitoxin system VapB family antitoxin [Spirochaetota bacterium]|nr:MAG: type II toxin-antitoxin system VapB family antitoxin [Spirochaetota bacterium]
MRRSIILIDAELIEEARRLTNLNTKREVIEEGLRALIRKKNRETLRNELGTYDIDLTLEELEKMRENRK